MKGVLARLSVDSMAVADETEKVFELFGSTLAILDGPEHSFDQIKPFEYL